MDKPMSKVVKTEAEWQAREQAPKTPGCVSKSPFA